MIAGFAPKKTTGDRSFVEGVQYIARTAEELKPGQERAVYVWTERARSIDTSGIEMEMLAGESRSQDSMRFFTASWAHGETPTIEQACEAAEIYKRHLGYEGLMQTWSLQNDGKAKLWHLHAVVCLVDPDTGRMRAAPETGKDVRWHEGMKCRAASREVEFTQGWERADNRTKREKAKEARERGLTVAQLRDLERPQQILAALTTHEVAFTKSDAHAMIMDRVKDKGKHAETLEAVMAQAVPLRHRGTGEEHFTTRAVIDAHRELDEALRGMAASRVSAIADDVSRARFEQGMTAEQRTAFAYATGVGGKLRVITGVPGAGKTFLIDRIADAYRSDGYGVRAVSVANSAVDVLRRDSSVPARSVCSEMFTWALDEKKKLSKRDLLIVDEASTLGAEWGRDLIAEACKRGATVLLTGDDRQFQAVAYGDALGTARAIEPGVDMKTTMRQKTEWQARATEDLRAGRIRDGLDAYHDHGLLHQHETQAAARAALVAQWTAIERDGVECGVETMTNDERIALNEPLRAAHDALGRLHGPEVVLPTMDGPTPFRAGDRIIVRGTIREAGLKNGSVATVERVKGATLDVRRRDGKMVRIDTRAENGDLIQHGYAATEYREQGSTRYAELQMVDSLVHQRSVVVGMTRHEHLYGMHYSAEKVGSPENLVQLAERERNKASLDDFTVRDLAAEKREQEQKIAPRRSVESPQPRRRAISDDDLAAAIERRRARAAAEEEHEKKIEQKRGMGRGR